MNTTDKTLLHISLISGIGPVVVAQLLHGFGKRQLSYIYTLTKSDFVHIYRLQHKQAQILEQGLKYFKALEQECLLLEKHTIAWISCMHDEYPALLKEIHVPPIGIYVQGQLPKNSTMSIGIVGSRKAYCYAQRVINNCVPDLVAHGWSIVSGGAIGADTMAHKAALKANGKTIVVLGSGLLSPYPSQNKGLFEQVIDSGGALISPFQLHMQAFPGNFPARNRIIAGISKGCVVVQAGKKSGAIITAYCALEQGREVFAVPGHIDDPLSAGCHALLRQGAVLVRSAEDIIKEFGYSYASRLYDTPHKQLKIYSNNKELGLAQEDDVLIHCTVPISVDELLEKTGLSLSEIYNRLSSLQLEGRIEQDFMGLWRKI